MSARILRARDVRWLPEKPDGQTMVMIGTESYATKEDAKGEEGLA